jgi:hypothetical protein
VVLKHETGEKERKERSRQRAAAQLDREASSDKAFSASSNLFYGEHFIELRCLVVSHRAKLSACGLSQRVISITHFGM